MFIGVPILHPEDGAVSRYKCGGSEHPILRFRHGFIRDIAEAKHRFLRFDAYVNRATVEVEHPAVFQHLNAAVRKLQRIVIKLHIHSFVPPTFRTGYAHDSS